MPFLPYAVVQSCAASRRGLGDGSEHLGREHGSTSRQFFQLHASSPAAANLARYDAAELRRAAATTLRPGSGSSRLPLETWLGHMTEEDKAMDAIRMEVDRLERLISVRSQQGVPGITPDDLAVAQWRP